MLKAFSDQQAAAHGIEATSVPLFSHDPQAELTSAILSAALDAKADVIVMAKTNSQTFFRPGDAGPSLP